ncbi:uncharacterized protein APUU_41705S [Aspergillus puulaauensis]|uniref:Major facilitator superfamily (MFS) profile domain-containing protein n=1 Tax=Aspergillus puulaauensis TaxID=1220207 RepID=A0A7R7XPD3_9EURO|nr:uncharacterized protein APUU_41705S [Aspergillus puulaauensis]BCS25261.1 hypothetical protein APUU_41705S [Aspergillus puulaauensis]
MAVPTPTKLGHLTPRLLRIFILASIGAMNFGYDNNWWSGAIASKEFNADFGRYVDGPDQPKRLPSSWLSTASGTPIAGWIVGCFVASYLTSSLGRRKTIMILCAVGLVGIIIAVHVCMAIHVKICPRSGAEESLIVRTVQG